MTTVAQAVSYAKLLYQKTAELLDPATLGATDAVEPLTDNAVKLGIHFSQPLYCWLSFLMVNSLISNGDLTNSHNMQYIVQILVYTGESIELLRQPGSICAAREKFTRSLE